MSSTCIHDLPIRPNERFTTDQCRSCWLEAQSSVARCPWEGQIVDFASCDCEDKHVRFCDHPSETIELCTRGVNGSGGKVVACISCVFNPVRS